jgi:hypothetical protein
MSSCKEDLPCATGKKYKVCFVNLGESQEGDYNPKDPKKKNLLRIDVYTRTRKGSEKRKYEGVWEMTQDASSCTGINVTAPAEHLKAVLRYALKRLEEGAGEEGIAGEISWFDNEKAAEIAKSY